LAADRVFCVHRPVRTPSELTSVRTTIAAAPISVGALLLAMPSMAASAPPKPAASAAIEPGKAIQKLVHPLRKPRDGPYASRR
jgi:hypothetical protein